MFTIVNRLPPKEAAHRHAGIGRLFHHASHLRAIAGAAVEIVGVETGEAALIAVCRAVVGLVITEVARDAPIHLLARREPEPYDNRCARAEYLWRNGEMILAQGRERLLAPDLCRDCSPVAAWRGGHGRGRLARIPAVRHRHEGTDE